MDGLNVAGNTRDFVVIGRGKSQLEDYMTRATDRYGLTVKNEPSPQAGYYYRSDHFSLARQGVPMLYAEGGEDLVEGGIRRRPRRRGGLQDQPLPSAQRRI